MTAIRRDDGDPQGIVLHRVEHDMGIGDDPVGSYREPGAMADGEDLIALGIHDHHPHHTPRGGGDVGGVRPACAGDREKDQREDGGKQAMHGRLVKGCDIDRKRREAQPIAARYLFSRSQVWHRGDSDGSRRSTH